MAPLDTTSFGFWGNGLLSVLVGFGFGFVLESAGFGDSRKLAGQFYLRDLTVVRVMFTAIVTAALLTFLATGLGLLDLEQLWVNPTFLPSVALGGLLFGVGFAIGGYCPGTSLVSAATLKLDGVFFVVGTMLGVLVYGESSESVASLMSAGDMGRFTLDQLLGWSVGATMLAVVVVAVAFLWLLGVAARAVGGDTTTGGSLALRGAAGLLVAGVAVALVGQPDLDAKWAKAGGKYESRLTSRSVYIDPPELVHLMGTDDIALLVLDVRGEADWNQYHLIDAERVAVEDLPGLRARFAKLPSSSVVVVMSNDEAAATRAWKHLVLLGAPNPYILAGGINRWIETYATLSEHEGHAGPSGHAAPGEAVPASFHPGAARVGSDTATAAYVPNPGVRPGDDRLHYRFPAALGDRQPGAHVDPEHAPKLEYEAKVKIQRAAKKSGGCG